jgi:NADH-quinone oxidoreductase subunit F
MFEPVLTRNFGRVDPCDISSYLANGGYEATRQALTRFTPDELIELVKKSGLRGRGGAGFPTGIKWGFLPKNPGIQKIVAVNADEGEPGTFKDRQIIESDPHQVLEGAIIASFAVGANQAVIYIRGEFYLGYQRLLKAVADAYKYGFLGRNILNTGFNLELSIHRGAGAYICGEETAMLESLEGKPGNPRLKPPFPAQVGLFGKPTLVQNVETLACVSHIVIRGADWFSNIGTAQSKGPKVFSVSGHVERPGNYELPLGIPLDEIIYEHAGGLRGGKNLKAIIPGGVSTPVLTADQAHTQMGFETLDQAGSQLGTGAIIVIDESTCMVEVARRNAKFYAHESCGRCAPCRIGSFRLYETLERIESGDGLADDIERALYLAENIDGRTFCPMGSALVNPARSTILKFREEYELHILHKACPAS